MAKGQAATARLQLTELLEQRYVGRALRARGWALLANCEGVEGHRLDPQWCDLDHNLETARLRVVALAHERHPDYNVDRLAALVGRGPSWLYAFLGRHRELPWVREILD